MDTDRSYDEITRELEGQTVVIVGGGPSLALVDLEPLRGRLTVIGVNNAYQKAPWCEYLFFADARWGHWHAEALEGYFGTLITSTPYELPQSLAKRVRRVRVDRGPRFMWTEPLVMNPSTDVISGADSGAQAIDLAVHMGAVIVVLLGFDMKFRGGRAHWHKDHPVKTKFGKYERRYLPQHQRIKDVADKLGVTILNATQDSAITCYPRVTLTDVLRAGYNLTGNAAPVT